jgi:pyruvate,water dikinase
MSPHTRLLSELRREDATRFGGKSACLGELLAAGVRVPEGFALECAAYPGRDRAMAPAVRNEIAARYAELGDRAAVAVRSSASGEDSAEATFAGQQETVLWVRGVDAVCDAVHTCWESLHSDTAVAYRRRLGEAEAEAGIGAEPAMGVTVQTMVDPEVAGVLFTCNPVSGDPSMVAINASWGLGVAVVAGEVTPDDYLVSKVTGEVVRGQIGSKSIEYVAGADRNGTVRRDVAPDRVDIACLDAAAIAELVVAARAIERHFGAPQDIEWAFAAGELFMLQSRPVTVIRERALEPASAIALVMKAFGAQR